MKADVIYEENGETKTIPIEAADVQTVYDAANQWRLNEKRISKRDIRIISIIF